MSRVAAATDASVVLDAHGAIGAWSAGAQALLGWAPERVLGRLLVDVVVPADLRDEVRAAIYGLLNGGREAPAGLRLQLPARHAGADPVPIDAVVYRDAGGGARALLFAAGPPQDLSRRFLADAAHQLRTPVAGIRSCAEALLGGVAEDKRDPLLARIVRETARATEMMTNLLHLARLESGLTLSRTACDLVALCANECDRLYARYPALDIVFGVTELFVRLPVLDVGAVAEIVANLLDNASRHAAGRIELEVAPINDIVEVRISDDGPGLAPDQVDAAFERFVSLDGKGGSGLGLPIARALARAHGGDLVYRAGTFVLTLPFGPPQGGATDAPPP